MKLVDFHGTHRLAVLMALVLIVLGTLLAPDVLQAGSLAADKFEWAQIRDASYFAKSYPFRVVGPATITIRQGMQPFNALIFSNKVDDVFSHNLTPGLLKLIKQEQLFDGKPLSSYPGCATWSLAGKVKDYYAYEVWQVPAGHTLDGTMIVKAPGVQTGCWTQHAAIAWFEVNLGDDSNQPRPSVETAAPTPNH